jgi:hypothetical protein
MSSHISRVICWLAIGHMLNTPADWKSFDPDHLYSPILRPGTYFTMTFALRLRDVRGLTKNEELMQEGQLMACVGVWADQHVPGYGRTFVFVTDVMSPLDRHEARVQPEFLNQCQSDFMLDKMPILLVVLAASLAVASIALSPVRRRRNS